MSRSHRRLVVAALSLLTVSTGSYGFAQVQEEQSPPDGVTCWAEECEGRVCVRIQIKCPDKIEPVPNTTSA